MTRKHSDVNLDKVIIGEGALQYGVGKGGGLVNTTSISETELVL